MATLLITYDLRRPAKDYPLLISAIKAFRQWARPAASTWLIRSTSSAREVRDYLRRFTDENDVVFVIEVDADWASFNVSQDVVDWLHKVHA